MTPQGITCSRPCTVYITCPPITSRGLSYSETGDVYAVGTCGLGLAPMHKGGITRCWVRVRPPTQTPLSMQDGGCGRRPTFSNGMISSYGRIPHNRGRRRGRGGRSRCTGGRRIGRIGRRHSGKTGGLGGTMQHRRGRNIKNRGQSVGDRNQGDRRGGTPRTHGWHQHFRKRRQHR